MRRNISDLLDSVEYSPLKTKTADTVSAEKIKELTMSGLTRNTARKSGFARRKLWLSAGAAAACLAVALVAVFVLQMGGGAVAYAMSVTMPNSTTITMEDEGPSSQPVDPTAAVSYVDSRPQLRFFITGEDIAKIEIISKTEYVSVTDFTQTLDEKFWNPELYYQDEVIDGVTYQYIPAKSAFDQSQAVIFPEGFTAYDQVWYDWIPWDLYDWADEDNYSHIQGYDGMSAAEVEEQMANMTEQEKAAIAAGGGDTSNAGHILLDGCPKNLLNDRVTITVTDRQGNTATKTLAINISNNALGQTVLTASMAD